MEGALLTQSRELGGTCDLATLREQRNQRLVKQLRDPGARAEKGVGTLVPPKGLTGQFVRALRRTSSVPSRTRLASDKKAAPAENSARWRGPVRETTCSLRQSHSQPQISPVNGQRLSQASARRSGDLHIQTSPLPTRRGLSRSSPRPACSGPEGPSTGTRDRRGKGASESVRELFGAQPSPPKAPGPQRLSAAMALRQAVSGPRVQVPEKVTAAQAAQHPGFREALTTAIRRLAEIEYEKRRLVDEYNGICQLVSTMGASPLDGAGLAANLGVPLRRKARSSSPLGLPQRKSSGELASESQFQELHAPLRSTSVSAVMLPERPVPQPVDRYADRQALSVAGERAGIQLEALIQRSDRLRALLRETPSHERTPQFSARLLRQEPESPLTAPG